MYYAYGQRRAIKRNTVDYIPKNFGDLFGTGLGKALWAFMNEHDTLIRMETATYLGRPAVEPLGPLLLNEFGDKVREHRVKQMIGHMVRQVVEARGYIVDRQGVRITRSGNLFTSGTRYVRREARA